MSRFYTRDDFDVLFSAKVPKGCVGFYSAGKRIGLGKIGEPFHVVNWDEVRLNQSDRWVCPETPQQRRRAG